jgi:hypothetical protein
MGKCDHMIMIRNLSPEQKEAKRKEKIILPPTE